MIQLQKKIVFSALLIFALFNAQTQTKTSKYFYIEDADWALVDQSKTGYTQESFLKLADNTCEIICNYLKSSTNINRFSNKIRIKFERHNPNLISTNRYYNGVIYISSDGFNDGVSALTHEMTHAILSNGNMNSFSEGLAIIIESMLFPYSQKNTLFNAYFHGNVHRKLNVVWRHNFSLDRIKTIFLGDIINYYASFEIQSFFEYLIETYGIEKFLDYFDTSGYSVYSTYHCSEDQLIMDWIIYVKSIEPDLVWLHNWDDVKYFFGE